MRRMWSTVAGITRAARGTRPTPARRPLPRPDARNAAWADRWLPAACRPPAGAGCATPSPCQSALCSRGHFGHAAAGRRRSDRAITQRWSSCGVQAQRPCSPSVSISSQTSAPGRLPSPAMRVVKCGAQLGDQIRPRSSAAGRGTSRCVGRTIRPGIVHADEHHQHEVGRMVGGSEPPAAAANSSR